MTFLPAGPGVPAASRGRAAGGGDECIELVRTWESSDDLILRTYSLVGLRADVDFMLWRIAFDSDYPQEFVDLVGRRRRPLTQSSRSWRTWISDAASLLAA